MPSSDFSLEAARIRLLVLLKALDMIARGDAGDCPSRPAITSGQKVLMARLLAISPALCPPMPSATANSPAESFSRWVLISKTPQKILSSFSFLASPVSQL